MRLKGLEKPVRLIEVEPVEPLPPLPVVAAQPRRRGRWTWVAAAHRSRDRRRGGAVRGRPAEWRQFAATARRERDRRDRFRRGQVSVSTRGRTERAGLHQGRRLDREQQRRNRLEVRPGDGRARDAPGRRHPGRPCRRRGVAVGHEWRRAGPPADQPADAGPDPDDSGGERAGERRGREGRCLGGEHDRRHRVKVRSRTREGHRHDRGRSLAVCRRRGRGWRLGRGRRDRERDADRSAARARSPAPSTVGNGPRAIAVGGGAVWVANSRDGTVVRINPASMSLSGLVTVGADPSAISVGDDGVWVASSGSGSISRIDPRTASGHEEGDGRQPPGRACQRGRHDLRRHGDAVGRPPRRRAPR